MKRISKIIPTKIRLIKIRKEINRKIGIAIKANKILLQIEGNIFILNGLEYNFISPPTFPTYLEHD